MKILVACEESQAVTIELRKRGHIAFSADIQDCSGGYPEWHIKGDVLPLLNGHCSFWTAAGTRVKIIGKWDMIIAFPPCTHLSRAGADKWKDKRADGRQQAAIAFVKQIYNADCARIAIENPIGILSTIWRKPDQIIQPYMFGHNASKPTCIWLKGLPFLKQTKYCEPEYHTYWSNYANKYKRVSKWFYEAGKNKKNRSIERSKTFSGVARAMAEQWTKDFEVWAQLDVFGKATPVFVL